MKPQLCIIHGGNPFDTQADYLAALAEQTVAYDRLLYTPDWKSWLGAELSDTHDVLLPSMPNKQNAQYDEWATYFSKILPFLRPDAILVGHSLGSIFLAKYLSEHLPEQPFKKLILVAAPYNHASSESLAGFSLTDVTALSQAAESIHLFYSTDDPVVPFEEMWSFQKDLPNAIAHVFDDRQHFNTLPPFTELYEEIVNS